MLQLEDEIARKTYNLGRDVRDWQVGFAKTDLINHYPEKGKFVKIDYRPFDDRWTFYTGKSKGFHCYPRNEVMQNFLDGENLGLMTVRQTAVDSWEHIGITKQIADDSRVSNRSKERGYILPLYLYPETNPPLGSGSAIQQTIDTLEHEGKVTERKPNLNVEIVKQIANRLALTFTSEKETTENTFAPIDILDYIYAVLHSPTYREKYEEFLKIDFPRVPYPKDTATFWQLVKLGGEIRQIHLLESAKVEQYITQYPMDGDNFISRKMSKSSPGYVADSVTHGKVYINDTQYFDNVPLIVWEFYIGGYQPAQKWLKDRKDHRLEFDNILHYQKIIVALSETDRLMKEIAKIKIE